MSYLFSNGFRLVTPYLDKIRTYVLGSWVGRQLLDILTNEYLNFLPINYIIEAFENERVWVSGCNAPPTHILRQGEIIEYLFHRHEPQVLADPIQILHVNEDFVVVNKPASIPVHPVGRFKKNTILGILKEEQPQLLQDGNKLNVVHRLDRLVSGVLIFARNSHVATRFGKLLVNGLISKEYIAEVKGGFPRGMIQTKQAVYKSQVTPIKYEINYNQGKHAVTFFKRQFTTSKGTHSIVLCRPITGRTHQIRVHLQWLGYPIVNDITYGGSLTNRVLTPPTLINKDYTHYDWCRECQQDRFNIPEESYYINLHALRYTSNDPDWVWSFEAPPPNWAHKS